MKTLEVVGVYNTLMSAKLTKMNGEGKIKVVKIIKALKPITKAYEEFSKDAVEKLKPEGIEEIQAKYQQWQREGDENTTLTSEEKAEVTKVLNSYTNDVNKCLEEEVNKEHDVTYDKLTEKEFQDLVDSNDYTGGQVSELMDYLTE